MNNSGKEKAARGLMDSRGEGKLDLRALEELADFLAIDLSLSLHCHVSCLTATLIQPGLTHSLLALQAALLVRGAATIPGVQGGLQFTFV